MSEQVIDAATLRTAFMKSLRNSLVVALIIAAGMVYLKLTYSPTENQEAYGITMGSGGLFLTIVTLHALGNCFLYWTHPVRKGSIPSSE
ncbi:MAG: hypothetical protein HQ488_00685 [Parcubacteria group bacterium]|nr:hypothetical protein [Parcubacteria group bacterium]